ncbi:Hypothetical_protein [Hexamita inflata]|uniref:Hypothetical_protein n=1 Tax=Hexamita inflata TaxID=28002 RepID=A0AA86QG97_9EUKA|nr:Hypothetical protein HINF_LOCUS46459 [Hexamita inflata]
MTEEELMKQYIQEAIERQYQQAIHRRQVIMSEQGNIIYWLSEIEKEIKQINNDIEKFDKKHTIKQEEVKEEVKEDHKRHIFLTMNILCLAVNIYNLIHR